MAMTEEAKEARRVYHRRWYAEHKAEREAAKARYWERKAEQLKKEANSNGNTVPDGKTSG